MASKSICSLKLSSRRKPFRLMTEKLLVFKVIERNIKAQKELKELILEINC
jgi:hypothetical protein